MTTHEQSTRTEYYYILDESNYLHLNRLFNALETIGEAFEGQSLDNIVELDPKGVSNIFYSHAEHGRNILKELILMLDEVAENDEQ